jgi:hypothetical protein
MRLYAAYAGPNIWGPWVIILSHLGIVNCSISAKPVGDTVLRCRVRYFDSKNVQVTEEWNGDVKITTSNSVANVEVSFLGIPLGSAVDGTVSP